MDQNELDQIFRQSLSDHSTALDKDLLWAAISEKKDKKSYRSFVFKTTMALVLLSLLGTALYQMIPLDSSVPSENHQQAIQAQKATSILANTSNNEDETADKIKKASNLQTTNTVANTSFNSTPTDIPAKTKNSSNTTKVKKQQQQLDHSVTLTSQSTTKSQILNNNTAHSTSATQNTTVVENNSELNATKAVINQLETIATKNITENKILNTTVANIASLYMDIHSKIGEPKRNYGSIECYDHRKKIDPFYLEAYSTVDFVKNRYPNLASEQTNYLDARKETLTQLEAYRGGLRFKYLTRMGLYFKSGLEIGVIKERFNRTETEERIEVLPNQLLEVITKTDTVIYIYGDKPVNIIEEKSWKVFNTYKSLDIPLLVGFQKQIGKLQYGIELGASYNILYDFEGMILDTTLEPTMDADYFKTSINTSLTGGLNIGYSLNERYRLMALTSFRHNLSNINNSDNPIRQSNSQIGIGLGLEIKL